MTGREKICKVFIRVMIILLLTVTMVLPAKAQAAAGLSKTSVTLVKGKTFTLKVTGTTEAVTWSTNKKTISKLTNKKTNSVKIHAVKVGRSTVTAKVGGVAYECKVRVVNPKISKGKLSLKAGNTKRLKVRGGTGDIKWKSSNKSVAIVDITGKVIALKPGKTKITAIQNKKKMTCTVSVKRHIGAGTKTKKIWVATEKAWTEKVPVYKESTVIECLSCGEEFEDGNEYDKHELEHMLNGEEGRYTVKTIYVQTGTKTVSHKEEGYWITIRY